MKMRLALAAVATGLALAAPVAVTVAHAAPTPASAVQAAVRTYDITHTVPYSPPPGAAAPAANHNAYFDGAVHPFGNPHWCFYGSLTTKIALQSGTPVVLEKCKSTSKHTPVAGEYWHGYKVITVGQMFLLAKPNYVLGRLKRKPPTVFVPFEHTSDADRLIAYMQDKHGHWHIDLTDQKNAKLYDLIMPEHLKATATYYAMKWHEADLGVPKGWTNIVILPTWHRVQTT